jgi:hypothetical protein
MRRIPATMAKSTSIPPPAPMPAIAPVERPFDFSSVAVEDAPVTVGEFLDGLLVGVAVGPAVAVCEERVSLAQIKIRARPYLHR